MKRYKKNEENDAHNENGRTIQTTFSAPDRNGEKWLGVFMVSNKVKDNACVQKHCSDGLLDALPCKLTH